MERIGDYELVRELARGGMGVVYLARATDGARCALKVILDLSNEAALARFRREAYGAARLDHPHLIRVRDFGVAAGRPYLVMPYLEGEDLSRRLRAGPFPIADALRSPAS